MAEDIYAMSISFLYIVTHFCYMFFVNYIGQQVIDYSSNIFKKTYNSRWYAAPLNTQKCFIIITYRSMKTYTLTIHLGLFVPSLEGFATLISKSLSYFMVLYSLR
ncbi:PREDICTED: odorant receptor 85b-like [Trachymyrmex septentrionalis]|uniref:odorant receptor 85b-like n=1 Tax=Trachymyrmex septentrionalis TaxID=34720 RepID=UPI00084F705E|nr:PREDICTED: odorant receptor 85b-like [Trachymyrmex septentrionalis]